MRPLPEQLTIVVTRDDITAGIRESQTECPIALAARRLTNRTVGVTSVLSIGLEDDDERTYELPPEALDFVGDFDDDSAVVPFTFTATVRHDQGA